MTKAKKKSVQYKIAYYDETGKRRGKTFSAPTMHEARLKAAEWEMNRPKNVKPRLTVSDAVEKYIELKRPILSPSTIRAYVSIHEQRIKSAEIGSMDVKDITSMEAQMFISSLAEVYSTKTVRNIYGLLDASIRLFQPDARLTVTMPAKVKKEQYCPYDDEVRDLIQYVQKKGDMPLLRAIYLAAFGGMRRGEICAATRDDVEGNEIHVNKSMVLTEARTWALKAPKTYESDRYVELPRFVLDAFKGVSGRLVPMSPDSLTQKFRIAVKNAGLPDFHIHTLRSYSASILHAIGIPDIYIMRRNGWSSPSVMNSHYKREIRQEKDKNAALAMKHFESIVRKRSKKCSRTERKP